MSGAMVPLVILVVGRPASGKTTLARRIVDRFHLPLLAKDDLKEILFDRLGEGDRSWSMQLGRASFALLDHAIEQLLVAGVPFVIEAAYDAAFETAKFEAWQRRFGFRALQVRCVAEKEVLVRRFVERAGSGTRHAGHVDSGNEEEFRASLDDDRVETLALVGDVVVLDVSEPEAVQDLLDRIEAELAA